MKTMAMDFDSINLNSIHSISYGPLRFPKAMYKKIFNLYPDEKLFTGPFHLANNQVAYNKAVEDEMINFCLKISLEFVPESIIFRCTYEG